MQVHGISLYYFLQLYVNLQFSQSKKFNQKTTTLAQTGYLWRGGKDLCLVRGTVGIL